MTALPSLLLMVTLAAAPARSAAPDSVALMTMLRTFLEGAGKPGAAVHERFWADDLIYTGSSGRRVSKADILRDIRSAPDPSPNDPTVTYGAEDVRIQQYGSTAIVAFKLVARTDDHGRTEVAHYLNTGTFVKRGGQWQVVGWQATRLTFAPEVARRGIGETKDRLWKAMTAADTTALAGMIDDGFVWTTAEGERHDRARLFAELASGALKVSGVADDASPVLLRGETAVVGGTARAGGAPSHWSLTLVREGGGWIALAIQSAKP